MTKTEAENDISAKIRAVKDIPIELKVLLYGRSGSGKTTTAGTFPSPVLILDVRDRGTISLYNKPDVDVLEIETWEEFEEAYYWLSAEGYQKYKTVVVDTVTQLQDLAILHVVGEESTLIPRRAWGETAGLMKTWVMLYRDLPTNIIFVAQDRVTKPDEDDEGDSDGSLEQEVGPYVMPSVAKILNASVGIAGQTFIREVELEDEETGLTESKMEYCLRIGPHARYYTKLRRDPSLTTDSMPSVLVNPTYKKLLKLTTQDIIKRKKKKGATSGS